MIFRHVRGGTDPVSMKSLKACGTALGLVFAVPCFAQSTPSAHTRATRYDIAGRVTGRISPDPDGGGPLRYLAERLTYNQAGSLVRTESGVLQEWASEAVAPADWVGFNVFQRIDTQYDSLGRKIRESQISDGAEVTVSQFSYDANGRILCTVIRMNQAAFSSLPDACVLGPEGAQGRDRITRNVYDAAGQLTQTREAVGTPLEQAYVTYTYTPNGKQEYVTDANGNRSRFIYDTFDRLFQWNFPDRVTKGVTSADDYEGYHYDANGNRTYKRTRSGAEIRYNYDALNRMTLKDVPGTAQDVYYGYDLNGLQTYARFGATNGHGINNTFDGFGRLMSSAIDTGGVSRNLSYQHDANGNRIRLTFPDNQFFTYEYDGLDRMTAIRENGGTQIAGFAYNDRGERTGISGGIATGFAYDSVGRLAKISHDMSDSSRSVTFCMGATNGSVCNSEYNAANQLLKRSTNNNAYAWNRHAEFHRTYNVNGLNQYENAGGPIVGTDKRTDFGYDANGNLTLQFEKNGDGSPVAGSRIDYAYDIENRLVGASGAASAVLSWDPIGRLWQTGGASTTRFLYDGDALVAELDASGNLLRRYVHGSGIDDPLVWYEGPGLGDRRHLRADHQGSLVAISDSAGTSIGTNNYDPYGIPGTGNIGRFQYTGQAFLPEIGLYHYKARIYSPTLGRFFQIDPVGYEDQMNLYTYVRNDPVNSYDPSGRETCTLNANQEMTCRPDDHTYRNALAAGGAVAGAALGGVTGGGLGGAGGAVAGGACGPAAVVCSPAGAVAGGIAGAVEGAAVAGTAGGLVGGFVGNLIDKGIALMNSSGDSSSSSSGGKGRELSGHAQDRMSERGVTPARVQEAQKIGRSKPGNTSDTIVREVPSAASTSGRGIRVVMDRATGRVITVIDKGSKFK